MTEPTAHLHVHLPRWFLVTLAVSAAVVALSALLLADAMQAHLTAPAATTSTTAPPPN